MLLTAIGVEHSDKTPCLGIRVALDRKVIAYSGDTGWTEALVEVAQGADLFITECYRLSGAPVAHLSLEEIDANRSRFSAQRIMLTHMSAEVLDKLAEIEALGYLPAHDGLTLDI